MLINHRTRQTSTRRRPANTWHFRMGGLLLARRRACWELVDTQRQLERIMRGEQGRPTGAQAFSPARSVRSLRTNQFCQRAGDRFDCRQIASQTVARWTRTTLTHWQCEWHHWHYFIAPLCFQGNVTCWPTRVRQAPIGGRAPAQQIVGKQAVPLPHIATGTSVPSWGAPGTQSFSPFLCTPIKWLSVIIGQSKLIHYGAILYCKGLAPSSRDECLRTAFLNCTWHTRQNVSHYTYSNGIKEWAARSQKGRGQKRVANWQSLGKCFKWPKLTNGSEAPRVGCPFFIVIDGRSGSFRRSSGGVGFRRECVFANIQTESLLWQYKPWADESVPRRAIHLLSNEPNQLVKGSPIKQLWHQCYRTGSNQFATLSSHFGVI